MAVQEGELRVETQETGQKKIKDCLVALFELEN